MKNKNQKILTISLLSIPLSAGVTLVPLLSNIAAVFPEQRESVQLLLTLPSLFMMFSSLLTDRLLKKTSIRWVSVISILMITFGGMSPYWIDSFGYLLFTRGLMGIGLGLLNTVIASLPMLYFNDSQTRDYAVGIQSAFVCVGAILFSLLSGTVAQYHWKYAFLVQLLNGIPLIMALFFMPKIEENRVPAVEKQRIFVKNALPVIMIGFITIMLTCTYPLNLSLFVEKQGLGTSQFVSFLASVNSAVGFMIGLIFGRVYRKTKEGTFLLGLALAAGALGLVITASDSRILFLGNVCFGIGTSFVSPSLYAMLYERVKPEEVVASVAMLGIACNVSQFISPFIINPIASMVDGHGLESTRLLIAGVCIFLLALVLHLMKRRHE